MRRVGVKRYASLLIAIFFLFLVTVFLYFKFDSVIKTTSTQFKFFKIKEAKQNAFAIENIFSTVLNLPQNMVSALFNNQTLQQKIDLLLSSFINDENRYVYLIYQDRKGYFRYLADGALNEDDKGLIGQKFFPLEEKRWKEAFSKRIPSYFVQENIDNLWITLLYPLNFVKDYRTFLVIDVSTNAYKKIETVLQSLKNFLEYLLIFFVATFFVIVLLYIFMHLEYKKTFIDPLTGVYNRNFLKKIEKSIDLDQVVIAMIDLDYFKHINDTYGHAVGDKILKTVAKAIDSNIRKEDILIRYGGEEFLLIFKKEESLDFPHFIERIRHLIRTTPIKEGDTTLNITASIGINLVPYLDKSLMDAIKKADIKLYQAKHNGRDRVEVFDLEAAKGWYLNFERITELIQQRRVRLFYQPIVKLSTGEIVKYEALARLEDFDGKIYLPHQFLPTISQTNIYRDFTKQVLELAFKTIKTHKVHLSVNFNKSDMMDDEYFYTIQNTLLENSEYATYLTFELLEGEDLKLDDTKIVERIHRLKELKCKLAIDDFGRGYSNLSYFLTLSPDILKIDGQIVKEVVKNENAKKIIRGIAIFCKTMKIEMVAEFVENEEIAKVLKKMGVDYGQGFYFGKPQPTLVFSKALDPLSYRSLCY